MDKRKVTPEEYLNSPEVQRQIKTFKEVLEREVYKQKIAETSRKIQSLADRVKKRKRE